MIQLLVCILIFILLICYISKEPFTNNTWKCDPYSQLTASKSFSTLSKSRCHTDEASNSELDNYNSEPESRECPEGSEKISAQESSNTLNKGFCR